MKNILFHSLKEVTAIVIIAIVLIIIAVTPASSQNLDKEVFKTSSQISAKYGTNAIYANHFNGKLKKGENLLQKALLSPGKYLIVKTVYIKGKAVTQEEYFLQSNETQLIQIGINNKYNTKLKYSIVLFIMQK